MGRLLACQASRQSFLGSLPGHLGVLSRPRGQVKAPEGCSRGPRGRPTQHSLGYSTSRTFSGHRHTATPALSPLAQTTPNHSSTPFPHAASQAALTSGRVLWVAHCTRAALPSHPSPHRLLTTSPQSVLPTLCSRTPRPIPAGAVRYWTLPTPQALGPQTHAPVLHFLAGFP